MKIIKWLCILLIPLFFFVMIIGLLGSSEKRGSESSGVCEYTNGITENAKLENQRMNVASKIVNKDLINAVLGIYAVNEYQGIDEIINTLDKYYVYVTDKDKKLSSSSYIQAYKWDITYLDYLMDNKKTSSVATNKEYEKSLGIEEVKDYNYYMKVLTATNKNCSSSTDGLPLLKPYTITGWFPNYDKNGSGDKHYGIDFGIEIGTDIFTVADGEVIASYNECSINDGYLGNVCGKQVGYDGSGNFVFIKSNVDGVDYYVMYCHMKDISVHKGDEVYKGQKVGTSGNSGNSTGAHLHFEVRKNAKVGSDDGVINPCEYVEGLCE